MQIVIACGAMPFGPETCSRKSLGGSETAALMLGKAIAARGHDITMFCNLPPQGAPDFFPSGQKHTDGVRYVDLAHYQNFVGVNPCDVLIAVRDPNFVAMPTQAGKKVLWMHDIATTRGMKRALEGMQFTFDEIWTVSEWHKHQVAEVTGYPADRIVALRNGIVRHEVLDTPRISGQLIYASRPERGLDNLIRPGGVMERLPEFKLLVAMYDHFPDHMKGYYEQIFARMAQMPNVEYIGPKANGDLRQIIHESVAYIYPTQFEETSCILARECIEQKTPFITTSVGALPETLDECGIYFEDWLHHNGITEPERGGDGWCMLFAQFFREAMQNRELLTHTLGKMFERTDLYWDGVAEMVEARYVPASVTPFSRLYSLIQDGDVIPARAYLETLKDFTHPAMASIVEELHENYAFVDGDIAEYYEETYCNKGGTDRNELVLRTEFDGPRGEAISNEIAKLPPGSNVFEFGCGSGHIIVPLARRFPQINFIGYDFSASAAAIVGTAGLANCSASATPPDAHGQFDAVICTEVLEHVVEPWKTLEEAEAFCKAGGAMIITTPFGAWEPLTFENEDRWQERNHLWEIDREMMKEMLDAKPEQKTVMIVGGWSEWKRPVGNHLFTFRANHEPIRPIDPLAKALRHRSRETCAAVIIAYNNEDTIIRLLNSLNKQVQFVQIALGPCTDDTPKILTRWFEQHPWMRYNIIDAPKIEPYKFGFDDARNLSTHEVGKVCEWMLWIDTDEYVSGDFRKYLRPSSLDGYLVSQHHFTCEPRGNPPEIDKPARLIRTDRNYKAFGHIHEHFEVMDAEGRGTGPGRAWLLPDVDIGHPGYVNEMTRQLRFLRNFPFLEWEHHEGGDRNLHHFLWFRDIIHRARFTQDPAERVRLAREGISYYNDYQKQMCAFGPGLFMALKYLAELHTVLGIGVPLKAQISLDDRNTMVEGRFANYEQFEAVMAQLLKDEFRERTGRYF